MKNDLEIVHQNNIGQLTVDKINDWVDKLNDLTEESTDEELIQGNKIYHQREWEGEMAHYEATNQFNLEGFRSTIQFAQTALKYSILINGGAAVALLAFIGHIWDPKLPLAIQSQISTSLIYFLWGIFVSAVATASSYWAQAYYSDLKRKKIGDCWRNFSCVLIISSYVLFLYGGYCAQEIFSTPPKIQNQIQTKQKKQNTGSIPVKKIFNQANDGLTALYLASQKGHETIVEVLLEKGVNADIQASDGSTALIQASQNGHEAIVKALLGKGVDVNLQTNNGDTALGVAQTKGIAQLLKAAGAK